GCSSNWQSSGFQIRVLGVRISPPLPCLKPQSKDWGFFAFVLGDFNLQLSFNVYGWYGSALHIAERNSRNSTVIK
ncbi:hypothetical protein, partial [Vibrio sp. YYF0003]|uniref:hypothetical protein n=1 Tax=Vibrio sp. YYF0003 TaxID=3116646 RepID=UPI002EBCC236|nr:hypothetical protein [Vibrio sp. YYF0003]